MIYFHCIFDNNIFKLIDTYLYFDWLDFTWDTISKVNDCSQLRSFTILYYNRLIFGIIHDSNREQSFALEIVPLWRNSIFFFLSTSVSQRKIVTQGKSLISFYSTRLSVNAFYKLFNQSVPLVILHFAVERIIYLLKIVFFCSLKFKFSIMEFLTVAGLFVFGCFLIIFLLCIFEKMSETSTTSLNRVASTASAAVCSTTISNISRDNNLSTVTIQPSGPTQQISSISSPVTPPPSYNSLFSIKELS